MSNNDFYEPTLLFRTNAIKKYNPSLSPISSCDSLSLKQDSQNLQFPYLQSNSSSSSWLLNSNNPNDTKTLYKSCSLNKTNVKSNYWKIPDPQLNLTSLAITNSNENIPKVAVSSGNKENNLFIYGLNLNNNHLIHHSTITLSNIHNMKWLDSKYLLTGNNKGYAHLISIPGEEEEVEMDDEPSAEIIKRFNHRKYLKNRSNTNTSQPITKLNLINHNQNLITIYNDSYLFNWDIKNSNTQLKPSPLTISTIPNIKNFDVNTNNSNYLSICGKFGISLFDLRECKFNIPNQQQANTSANIIKWNPNNENLLAVGDENGVIRLWDLRKQDSFINLYGHGKCSQISSLEWINNNDLISGGSDGNIIHWDLSSDNLNLDMVDHQLNCGLSQGFDSFKFNNLYNQRQCGTILPASNSSIVSMCSIKNPMDDDVKVLSIDGSSFLGVHSKIQQAINVNINSSKLYYTESDLQLLLNSNKSVSDATLLNNNSSDSIIEPLEVARKQTITYNNKDTNKSNDTLIEAKSQQVVKLSKEVNDEGLQNDDDDLIELSRNGTLLSTGDNSEFISIDHVSLSPSSSICHNSPNATSINDSFDSISTIATDKDLVIDSEDKLSKNLITDASSGMHKRIDSNEFVFHHIFNSLDEINIA